MFDSFLARFILVFGVTTAVFAQTPEGGQTLATAENISGNTGAAERRDIDRNKQAAYVLGPKDQIQIRMTDVEELGDGALQIDNDGFLRLPLIGRVQASGLTVTEFEARLTQLYSKYLVHPDISVSVAGFHSQPVSVVGAVKNPGVYQVEGQRTIFEMLSLAGGLDQFAGSTLKITRRLDNGRIPLPNAADDPTGQFSVAELKLKSILTAANPAENIAIKPHDVITVPRAQTVYVVGEVQKAGGFLLNEHESMSVLQALSLAGGLDRAASPQRARVLRASAGQSKRTETAVNLKAILDGKAPDVQLNADDILFIPNSQPKRAAARAAEAAIQLGTGIVIWRR
jgi:polysaccharide export outer membrane protein